MCVRECVGTLAFFRFLALNLRKHFSIMAESSSLQTQSMFMPSTAFSFDNLLSRDSFLFANLAAAVDYRSAASLRLIEPCSGYFLVKGADVWPMTASMRCAPGWRDMQYLP